jgi:methylase of polypeptide subunit release factors
MIEFLGTNLEYNEKVFRPTLLSEKCALNVDFKNKDILDLGCGIGPLAIYFSKNGASSVDACDLYDEHIKFTKKNAKKNNVSINVFKSDLFKNVKKNYDIICCDVSGVKEEVAKLTGWFPEEVPKADNTGANLILEVIKNSKQFLNSGGSLIVCTTSFSEQSEIYESFKNYYPMAHEKIYSEKVPFSKRLLKNIEVLNKNSYEKKNGIYYWEFSIFSLQKN